MTHLHIHTPIETPTHTYIHTPTYTHPYLHTHLHLHTYIHLLPSHAVTDHHHWVMNCLWVPAFTTFFLPADVMAESAKSATWIPLQKVKCSWAWLDSNQRLAKLGSCCYLAWRLAWIGYKDWLARYRDNITNLGIRSSAGGSMSQWDRSIKPSWVSTVTRGYLPWYDLTCC